MDIKDFEQAIQPFFGVKHENSFSVCLNVGEYKTAIFQTREEEGFQGNGYDWESLALVFLKEQKPALTDVINFDPEANMFCAYSSNEAALQEFMLAFKQACENEEMIQDLFSRAELD